jgi:hypothetical protein
MAACDRRLAELGPLEMSVHADIIGLAGRPGQHDPITKWLKS